jgi:hypothetical protein
VTKPANWGKAWIDFEVDVDPELIPVPPPHDIEPLRQSIFAQEAIVAARIKSERDQLK